MSVLPSKFGPPTEVVGSWTEDMEHNFKFHYHLFVPTEQELMKGRVET